MVYATMAMCVLYAPMAMCVVYATIHGYVCTPCCVNICVSTLLFCLHHRRERHEIPLIVQTCIDEVERRGVCANMCAFDHLMWWCGA